MPNLLLTSLFFFALVQNSTPGALQDFGNVKPGKAVPAKVDSVVVYLSTIPGSHKGSSCKQKLGAQICQDRLQAWTLLRQGNFELQTGNSLLDILDFKSARQHCVTALQDYEKGQQLLAKQDSHSGAFSVDAFLPLNAATCVAAAGKAEDEIVNRSFQQLQQEIDSYAKSGEIERARTLYDTLRERYLLLPPTSRISRATADRVLSQGPPVATFRGALSAWLRSEVLPMLFRCLLYSVLFLACLLVTLPVLRLLFQALRFLFTLKRKSSFDGITKWFVQSIKDSENQSAAGAVMDALSIEGNALLREPFKPPALLLTPPGFGPSSGTNGIWWEFFGERRPKFDLEMLPLKEMKRHLFIMDDALDEINLKVAGAEVSGLVSLGRTISQFFSKGYPTVNGAILKVVAPSSVNSWGVRLTASYRSDLRWGFRRAGSREERRRQNTLSVYSSSLDSEFGDGIGLAAQRSAFKLFYRLAKPKADPDMATSAAALHQALVLLRRYI